jgi:hypothetical protein
VQASDVRASGSQLIETNAIEPGQSAVDPDRGDRQSARLIGELPEYRLSQAWHPRCEANLPARLLCVVLLLIFEVAFLSGTPVRAQVKKPPARKLQTKQANPARPANPVVQSKADLIKAATEHKTNLEKEVTLLDEMINRATAEVEKKRSLLELGIIAKRELEQSEQALALAKGQRAARQSEVGATDNLITEATAAEQIARLKPMPMGGYLTTATLIRYIGPTRWLLSDVSKVESFFLGRFNHQLPISALGQTPVHDRLGFDHHESVDVAVHPDSFEGQVLIAYLRNAGISFIAFRQAVAGSATGAHIHIGLPSHRLIR